MGKVRRKEDIYAFIMREKICSIESLLNEFDVSVSTIHRDLNVLEREGRISKFHGRVTIKEDDYSIESRMRVNIDLKQRIAGKALSFIESGDCLFFDDSTTVYQLARALCESNIRNVTVVSNGTRLLDLFLKTKNIDFFSTGGKLNDNFDNFIGPQALRTIEDFNGSKYFFSTSYISVEGGVSDLFSPDEMAIKTKMFEKSRETFLLADSTKFGKTSVVKLFDVNGIDHIISDSALHPDQRRRFEEAGIGLITV